MTDFASEEPYEYDGQKHYGVFVLREEGVHKLFKDRKKAEEYVQKHRGEVSAVIHEFRLILR